MVPGRSADLVEDVDGIAELTRIHGLEVANRRAVRRVDFAPGAPIVSGFHHHEQVARLCRLHDEVQVTVGSLPGPDTSGRFDERASDMSGRNGKAEYRVSGGTLRYAVTVD